MGAFHLAVEPGRERFDVDVADPTIQKMPVESGLEFGSVVRLDRLDLEGELLEDVVDELDGTLLVEALKDAQDPQPGAVVNGCELVVTLSRALEGFDELHIDLDLVAW